MAWYRPRRGEYPWRRPLRPDPYAVLVSEVMLQQTQTSRVAPAYQAFLQRFPTVEALAEASRGSVIRAWSGLGYNRRAVALHEAARTIVADYRGRIPGDTRVLERLPGIGTYTAAAVASIAFGAPVAAIDTNARRVIARAVGGVDPDALHPRDARLLGDAWLDPRSPGMWNQAVMDLGREVCRPQPRCAGCPLAAHCRYRQRRPGTTTSAGPATRTPKSSPFDGSFRQVRGAVVAALRLRSPLTLKALERATGRPTETVVRAVQALAGDGLVAAGPAALAGRRNARVSLAP